MREKRFCVSLVQREFIRSQGTVEGLRNDVESALLCINPVEYKVVCSRPVQSLCFYCFGSSNSAVIRPLSVPADPHGRVFNTGLQADRFATLRRDRTYLNHWPITHCLPQMH